MICACGCGRPTTFLQYGDSTQGIAPGGYRKFCLGHQRKGAGYPLRARLERHTQRDENGCLVWVGRRTRNGYGKLTLHGKTLVVSRAVWEEANGPIPYGMRVCHKCDNRACAELGHLFLGTDQENTDDKVAKKRHAHGETTGTAKLNTAQVVAVKRALKEPCNKAALARQFQISRTQLGRIATGKSWAHVTVA